MNCIFYLEGKANPLQKTNDLTFLVRKSSRVKNLLFSFEAIKVQRKIVILDNNLTFKVLEHSVQDVFHFRCGIMNWNWKLKPGPTNVSETMIVRSVGHWTDLRSDKIFIGLAI